MPRRSLIELQNGQERLLGHFDRSDLLHALLSFFLFFEQFALARDIAVKYLRSECRNFLLGNPKKFLTYSEFRVTMKED